MARTKKGSELQIIAAKRNLKGVEHPKLPSTGNAEDTRLWLQQYIAPDLPAIIDTAKAQAKEGDKDARSFIFEHAYGRAPQVVQSHSTVEHHYSGQVNVAVLAAQAALALKDVKLE